MERNRKPWMNVQVKLVDPAKVAVLVRGDARQGQLLIWRMSSRCLATGAVAAAGGAAGGRGCVCRDRGGDRDE